jgi:phosphocarrier protein HPr
VSGRAAAGSDAPGERPADGMLWRRVTIVNRRGLHARAAARFVRVAEQFHAEIAVAKDDMTVSGTSIMGLMMLAAAQGSTLELRTGGREAEAALEALAALVEKGFDET